MPKCLIEEPDFRVVDTEIDGVGYVLEVRDGCDALGVERWKKFETASANLRAIFGYLVRVARKQE